MVTSTREPTWRAPRLQCAILKNCNHGEGCNNRRCLPCITMHGPIEATLGHFCNFLWRYMPCTTMHSPIEVRRAARSASCLIHLPSFTMHGPNEGRAPRIRPSRYEAPTCHVMAGRETAARCKQKHHTIRALTIQLPMYERRPEAVECPVYKKSPQHNSVTCYY